MQQIMNGQVVEENLMMMEDDKDETVVVAVVITGRLTDALHGPSLTGE